jgi:hypothetical protein
MAKTIYIWVIVLITGFIISVDSTANERNNWDVPTLNTAATADYLTGNEKAVILEINKLRSNPVAYAEEYLEPMLSMYRGKLLYMPGNDPIITREGIVALREAIKALKAASPSPPILPDHGLTKASRDHQKDQSKTGQTGHKGSNGSSMRHRIERYVEWDKKIAENIFYGDPDAISVVLHLVIDDGVPGRGHRINFLDPDFRYIGVSCGTHKVYRYLCVMNFAGGFRIQEASSDGRLKK